MKVIEREAGNIDGRLIMDSQELKAIERDHYLARHSISGAIIVPDSDGETKEIWITMSSTPYYAVTKYLRIFKKGGN